MENELKSVLVVFLRLVGSLRFIEVNVNVDGLVQECVRSPYLAEHVVAPLLSANRLQMQTLRR